jgi:hypothetical protein
MTDAVETPGRAIAAEHCQLTGYLTHIRSEMHKRVNIGCTEFRFKVRQGRGWASTEGYG